MSASAVVDLLNAYAFTLEEQAEKLDEVQADALERLDLLGAAEAKGAASSFRAVAEGLRSSNNVAGNSGRSSQWARPGDADDRPGHDLTPADLHDDWQVPA